jgi:hypothetical protein
LGSINSSCPKTGLFAKSWLKTGKRASKIRFITVTWFNGGSYDDKMKPQKDAMDRFIEIKFSQSVAAIKTVYKNYMAAVTNFAVQMSSYVIG